MGQRRTYRPATAIGFGVSTITIFLMLATLWNILLVYERPGAEVQSGISATVHWVVLIIGYVLFVLTAVGIVYLFVLLLNQIKTNQQQQNFIDSVSHELRSPLTSIKLHLETLQRRALPEDKRTEFVSLMLSDVARLSRLIEQVLEAAKRDHPQRTDDMEAILLKPLIEQVVADVRRQHAQTAPVLTADGPDLAAWSRFTDLRLVLDNLVDNAVKYSDPPAQVRVTWQPAANGLVEIQVTDRGIGMSRPLQRRAFQRFVRGSGEAAAARKGTGLGLYIVKETLKGLRGRVAVHSAGEGAGCTFTVRIPMVLGESGDHG